MKTKNISFTIVLAMFIFNASAQNDITQRVISKDVQKIANKEMLSNERLLTVASLGYPAWIISKNVQAAGNKQPVVAGNMISAGYPFWTISKGVYRKVNPVKEKPLKPLKEVIANL